jgi:TRAP-type uncharacterized transport system substrate-binding protein
MKMMKMLGAIGIVTTMSMSMSMPAAAATDGTIVKIAVGDLERGYAKHGKKIQTTLEQRSIKSELGEYTGSDDISIAICRGDADIGIAQIDAIYTRSNEGCKVAIIGIYGNEYAYLLVPPSSDIDELHDMGAGNKLLVDLEGSGTSLFFDTIVGIDTGKHGNNSSWTKVTPVHEMIMDAETLAAARQIDAVLMVTTPDSAELKRLLGKGWKQVMLDDSDVTEQEFNGAPLYARAKAEIAGTSGWFSGNDSARSYVIPSFVIMRENFRIDRGVSAFKDVKRAVSAANPAGL